MLDDDRRLARIVQDGVRQVLSVDTFLYEDGVYAFSPERVELAKKLCFERPPHLNFEDVDGACFLAQLSPACVLRLKLLVQSGQCRRQWTM